MLILTRKVGQVLYIGDARVVILGSELGRVKVGIEAPDGVHIVRGELLENLLDAVNSETTKRVVRRERK